MYEIHSKNGNLENQSRVVTWNFILGFINLGPVMLVLLKSQIPGYTPFSEKKTEKFLVSNCQTIKKVDEFLMNWRKDDSPTWICPWGF